jgi:hypothetical protein
VSSKLSSTASSASFMRADTLRSRKPTRGPLAAACENETRVSAAR